MEDAWILVVSKRFSEYWQRFLSRSRRSGPRSQIRKTRVKVENENKGNKGNRGIGGGRGNGLRMVPQSLRTRFLLSVVVVYVFFGICTFMAINYSTGRIIQSLGARFAVKQALLEKSRLMSQVQRDLSLSLKMAGSPVLHEWARHESNPELRRRAMRELESYRESFEGKSLFFAIASSGHYYYNDGSEKDVAKPRYSLDVTDPNDAWFFRTMREVENFELSIDYDNHLDINKIWYNVVIRDDDGRKLGLGGSGMDMSRFINQVVNLEEPGIETILFTSDGTIEGHRNHDYVLHNAKVRGKQKKLTVYDLIDQVEEQELIRRSIARLIVGRSEVESFELTVGDRRYLAALAHMEEIRWYNLVLVDAEEVIGSRSFLPIVAIVVIALLLMVVVIGFLLNNRVLSPLALLARSADRMAAGDFDVVVQPGAKDEIGALTTSFTKMVAMVRDHQENLEQKVLQRTEELNQTNQRLAESTRKLLDSLHYARLIQNNILPGEAEMLGVMTDFFALYRPRDMVGGDFYFFRRLKDGWLLALCDCTGHGVPGAFMTMTANALLANLIDGSAMDNPAAILTELDRRFQASLHSGSGLLEEPGDESHAHEKPAPAPAQQQLDYGLDIGLCRYRESDDTLVFSGARIDLYYLLGDEVRRLHGQRRSIGYRRGGKSKMFVNSEVTACGEGCYFLSSDGLLDQAGGENGWGFGRVRYTDLLARLADQPGSRQRWLIQAELAAYQGDCPQRDDITVIGFRPQPRKG